MRKILLDDLEEFFGRYKVEVTAGGVTEGHQRKFLAQERTAFGLFVSKGFGSWST
jgi:hypothetical protein